MIENLLQTYQDTLKVKHITTKKNLVAIIRLDLEKVISALLELQTKNIDSIITEFFQDTPHIIPETLALLNRQGKLCHLGFEINEPLDLALDGFNKIIDKFNQQQGQQAKIIKTFRFPASNALQDRVQAVVEIMRIWLNINGTIFLLELFDIHHSVKKKAQLPINKHHFKHLIQQKSNYLNLATRCHPFVNDGIWHYAIAIENLNEVRALHQFFQQLSKKHPSFYRLPFEQVVVNENDGSFYSKIINCKRNIELEFVSQIKVISTEITPQIKSENFSVS